MANKSVWIGGRKVIEMPGSPRMQVTPTGRTWTRTWKGPYDLLEKKAPLIGDLPPDMSLTGIYVSDCTLEHAEAGSGVLTLVVTQPIRVPKRRVTWAYEDKDLLTLPRYDSLTDAELALTRKACEEADISKLPVGSSEWDPETEEQVTKPTPAALDAFTRYVRGDRTVRVYYPVVTLVTYSPKPTANTGSALNTIQQPPAIARAPYRMPLTGKPWIYIATADQDADLDDGTTERTQEWQGHYKVDKALLANHWWDDTDETV